MLSTHTDTLRRSLQTCKDKLASHPRAVATGVTILLGGFAAAAFGTATSVPDPSAMPRRLVTETIAVTSTLDDQLDALSDVRLELTRSGTTRSGDTADAMLKRLGISDAEAAQFLRTDATARRLLEGRTNKMVVATAGAFGRLNQLTARYPVDGDSSHEPTQFSRLSILRDAAGALHAALDIGTLVAATRLGSGTIRSSLFAATEDSGLPDAVAEQMADMFSTEIDFHRELRKGDTFSVVYETLTADGEPINWNEGAGRVLAAEFVNAGETSHAVWYGAGKGGYFDYDGRSKRRSFMASPLPFSRVTSGFAMRFHPVLQTWRAHLGTDYGAPTGTPVRVVGDGVVSFAAWQNGYGNVVQVQHSDNRMTVYAHLSRIDVRPGQRVEQGARLGAVGATGWATGPHLHFEFRVNGQHKDPLAIAKASETVTLEAAQRPDFLQQADRYKSQLAAAHAVSSARDQFE